VPHVPQWSGLLKGLTHTPAQHSRPVPHAASQPPPPDPPELPPVDEPLLDAPPELLPPPELEPLEPDALPLDDEDDVLASSPALSADASAGAPVPNVEPPHATAMTATTETESAFFIEFSEATNATPERIFFAMEPLCSPGEIRASPGPARASSDYP
jgi:hypothetical protein